MVRGMQWKIPLIIILVVLAIVSAWPPQQKIPLGMDLKGGAELRYQIDISTVPVDEQGNIGKEAINVIDRRLDPDGVMALDIRPLPGNQVLIRLPGLEPGRLETIRRRVETISPLEFRLICNEDWEPQVYDEAQKRPKDNPPAGYKWMALKDIDETGKESVRELLVRITDDYELTGKHISRAGRGRDEGGLPAISFEFNAEGGAIMGRLTGENVGRPMGIILSGRLVSVANIREKITRHGIISRSGGFPGPEIEDQVAILRSGSLPAKLNFLGQDFVGPSLGQDSIRKGIQATLVAVILVLVFMAAYYLVAGLVANLALTLNLVLLMGALAGFNATLTLPGIAGIVLTIGMAVDANVLIFERIREERAKGKVLRFAVKNGYERAFTTIVDANVTTLITALILFYTGSGPVRGFAVTLSLGIVISMFTALFVTRVVIDLMVRGGWVKELRMHQFVRSPRFRFLRAARPAMLVSAVLIFAGLAFFFYRGEDNLGIDLTSGSMLHLQLRKPMEISRVRQMVRNAGYEDAEVQSSLGDDIAARYQSSAREFKIRTRAADAQKVEADIRRLFLQYAPDEPVTFKPPTFQEHEADTEAGTARNLGVRLEVGASLTAEQIRAGLVRAGFPEATFDIPAGERGADSYETFTVWLGDVSQEEAKSQLVGAFVAPTPFKAARAIGTSEARETIVKAFYSIGLAIVAIILYVWVRFGKFRYGLAAVIALVHDVAITLGAIALADRLGDTVVGRWLRLGDVKIDLAVIGALLTIIGYSLNDTIVVFDRIRERLSHRRDLSPDLVNASINQTLSRTLLTSVTTLLVTLSLYLLGGARIHGFAFALTVGVLVGTYSSIFIASPLLVWRTVWTAESRKDVDKGNR